MKIIENYYYKVIHLSYKRRLKAVIKKLLQSVTEVYYKVRQVLQSVAECYCKVYQVFQSMTGCYYKVRQVLQSVTVVRDTKYLSVFSPNAGK